MSEMNAYHKQKLEQIKRVVAGHLNSIERDLPPGYKLTFVARHQTIKDAQMIVTDDPDLEAVANELLNAKAVS